MEEEKEPKKSGGKEALTFLKYIVIGLLLWIGIPALLYHISETLAVYAGVAFFIIPIAFLFILGLSGVNDIKDIPSGTRNFLSKFKNPEFLKKIGKGFILVLVAIGIISLVRDSVIPFLRDYSETQERKEIFQFMCNSDTGFLFSDACFHNETEKNWQYRPLAPETKYFTSKEECADYCAKQFESVEKTAKEEMFPKKYVEEIQESYPELQKSFWHKLTNWLEKL